MRTLLKDIIHKNKKSIFYLIRGSEIRAFELWCYYNNLLNKIKINIIKFNKDNLFNFSCYDFHGRCGPPEILLYISHKTNNKSILNEYAKKFNSIYFNKCMTWRGNYYKKLHSINPYFIEQLNIKLLSSNYQGF